MAFGKKQLIENDNIDNNNNHTYNQSNSVKEGVFYIEQEDMEHNNGKSIDAKGEKKRKKHINANIDNENQQQISLFDERKMPQKKSFIGRVLNAFNTSSFTIYEDKDSFLNDDESDDFFSTPTIVRNKKLA